MGDRLGIPVVGFHFVLFALPFAFYSSHCARLNYCCDWFPSKNNRRGHTVLFKIVLRFGRDANTRNIQDTRWHARVRSLIVVVVVVVVFLRFGGGLWS